MQTNRKLPITIIEADALPNFMNSIQYFPYSYLKYSTNLRRFARKEYFNI